MMHSLGFSTCNIALLLAPVLAAAQASQPVKETVEESGMTAHEQRVDNLEFSLAMYDRLRNEPGNVFFSPYSISAALEMTAVGARGVTLAEMAKVLGAPESPEELGAPESPEELAAAYGKLSAALKNACPDKACTLEIANAIWAQDGEEIRAGFRGLVEKYFAGGFNAVDFAGHAERERKRINDWVEQQTKGHIKELMGPETVTPATVLVLTNAVYFKGEWATQFVKDRTREADFHVGAEKTFKVPMMNRTDEYRVLLGPAIGREVNLVALPYVGDRLEMVVVVPKDPEALVGSTPAFSAAELGEWLEKLDAVEPRKVQVGLPRFSVDAQYGLVKPLAEMGMPSLFDPRQADLSGIAGTPGELVVSAVVHKAHLEVNEEGSEAAAATGVGIVRTSIDLPPKVIADRPFMVVIRDRATGTVLFLGRIVEPAA